jgi:tripartite motif-containing protein 71
VQGHYYLMLPDRPGWKSIWLGLASTPPDDGYLYIINEVRNSQTAVFDRRLTIGPADQDSDDFISTLSMGDWSGGGQIDELSGADQSRYWWGIFDNRSPHQATLPPYVFNPDTGKPSGATGTSYPLGVVNNTMYFAFGTDICGWNEAGGVWYTKETMTHAPVGKGVSFNGALYVPCGTNGYKIITESGTGNPTVTSAAGVADPTTYDPDALIHTNPQPIAFCLFEGDKIFALTVSGGIAYSMTGASDSWEWDFIDEQGKYPKLNSSYTPYGLKPFFNRNGIETLFINHSGGVHNYQRAERKFNNTSIAIPSYPDMARAMEIWRPGEDLWVSMGLDVIHYTAANTTIPLSGVNRDAGLPAAYRGRIVDLQAEVSALYAIVGGVSEVYRSFEYQAKTGANGSSNGQFSGIQAAAVDASENIYIADLNNERIQKFNSSLVYQAQGGTSGSGDGQFAANDGVYDLAVDESNNVWAVDTANHRIQKFNSSLTYQSQIDGRISITTLNAYGDTIGQSGTDPGEFQEPIAISVDPSDGQIRIADFGNNQIDTFSSAESYTSAISSTNLSPRGVAHDSSGNIYYTGDVLGVSKIHKVTSAGVAAWNTNVGLGYIGYGVAADTSYVYVIGEHTGSSSWYIAKFNASTGAFVTKSAVQANIGGAYIGGIALAGGLVYYDIVGPDSFFLGTLPTSLAGSPTIITSGTRSTSSGSLHTPAGLDIHPTTGNIFVADTASDYVSEFTVLGSFVQRFTHADLTFPADVAITPSGSKIYVVDGLNNHFVRFDNSSVLSSGTAVDKFNRPKYLAIHRSENMLWTYDSGNNKIKKWDISATPTYSSNIDITTGSSLGTFHSTGPGRMAIDQSSPTGYYVYVLDPGNDRVNVYRDGVGWVSSFGSNGTENGQFQNPTGIAVSEITGNVFVTDDSRDDIQEFTALGQFVRKFGSSGTGNGQMTGSVGMAAGRTDSYVYLTDNAQSRLTQFFDEEVNDSLSTVPHLQRWTGIGWGGVWEGTSGVTPTWMNVVSVVGGYYLCWGADDGLIYRMNLNRYIHNPRQLVSENLAQYAASGYFETASTDMNMLGFKKIASHVIVFMRNATSTERVRVWIDIDDTGYQPLGYVTQPGKTVFPLNVLTNIDEEGNSASLGIAFNWVRMKFDLERGDTISRSPIIRSVNLHFLKIPQNTTTYEMDVVLPKDTFLGRDGREISDYVNSLLTADEMVLMKHQGKLYRGRISNVRGIDTTGEDMSGTRSINFLEISDEGGSG